MRGRPERILVFSQFADAADAAVAEVVDVVHRPRPLRSSTRIFTTARMSSLDSVIAPSGVGPLIAR